jgi:O-acetyl-ADP-ribose deacetylase (regulator of RNase III)
LGQIKDEFSVKVRFEYSDKFASKDNQNNKSNKYNKFTNDNDNNNYKYNKNKNKNQNKHNDNKYNKFTNDNKNNNNNDGRMNRTNKQQKETFKSEEAGKSTKGPKTSGVIFKGLQGDVVRAVERIEFLLADKKEDHAQLTFDNELLSAALDFQVESVFEESQKEDVTFKLFKDSPLVRSVALFGDPMAVDNLKSSIQSLDLRCDDSIDTSTVDQASISSLPLNELETKYEVKIVLDSKTKKIKVVGASDAVTIAVQQVKSLLANTNLSTSIKCSPKVFSYVFKFHFPELKAKEGDALSAEPKLRIFVITGKMEDLIRLKDVINGIVKGITETKFTRLINSNLVKSFETFLESTYHNMQVVFACTIIEDGEKEYEDDHSDTSSTTSSSSSPLSRLHTSSSDVKSVKTIYDKQVNVSIWHSPSIQKEVDDAMESIQKKKETIKYSNQEIINKLRFVSIEKTHIVSIYNDYRKQLLYINGFTNEHVLAAKQAINNLIDNIVKNLVIRRDVYVNSPNVMDFLNIKRKVYLRELQQQYSLRAAELFFGNNERKGGVHLNGPTMRVAQAEEDVKQLLQSVREESMEVPYKSNDLGLQFMKELRQIQKEVEEERDALLMYWKHSAVIKVILVGASAETEWKQMRDTVENLNKEPHLYSPKDFTLLLNIVLKNKLVGTYKNDYALRNIYFNKNTSQVEISARNQADIDAAVNALESLLHKESIITDGFEVGNVVGRILARMGSKYAKIKDEIKRNNKVDIVKRDLSHLQIRGTAENVQKARAKLDELIQEIQRNITTQPVSMPVYVASEFTNENKKLQKELFEETGTWLEFPEENSAKVIATLKMKRLTVEVIAGNITDEPTDCIVNAANGILAHSGGVAAAIASKCGVKLQDECKAIMEKRTMTQIPAGNCVVTSSGDLASNSSIRIVVHAVGPVWEGGIKNEEKQLESAVLRSLQAAATHGCTSISIPAISSGIFGYPKDKCAAVLVQTVLNFTNTPQNKISVVRFCDKDKEILDLLAHNLVKLGKELGTISQTNSPSNLDLAYKWSWMEDNGTYLQYIPHSARFTTLHPPLRSHRLSLSHNADIFLSMLTKTIKLSWRT